MQPFWQTKRLDEMTPREWESLCDGCGLCCRHKEEDEDTGEITYTHIACRLLDIDTGRCTDYPNRRTLVPACITLTPRNVPKLKWLPLSCAYRRVAENKDLYDWHPLISGDPETPHRAGFTVRHHVISEEDL